MSKSETKSVLKAMSKAQVNNGNNILESALHLLFMFRPFLLYLVIRHCLNPVKEVLRKPWP